MERLKISDFDGEMREYKQMVWRSSAFFPE